MRDLFLLYYMYVRKYAHVRIYIHVCHASGMLLSGLSQGILQVLCTSGIRDLRVNNSACRAVGGPPATELQEKPESSVDNSVVDD